jgi:hypothetical protein
MSEDQRKPQLARPMKLGSSIGGAMHPLADQGQLVRCSQISFRRMNHGVNGAL